MKTNTNTKTDMGANGDKRELLQAQDQETVATLAEEPNLTLSSVAAPPEQVPSEAGADPAGYANARADPVADPIADIDAGAGALEEVAAAAEGGPAALAFSAAPLIARIEACKTLGKPLTAVDPAVRLP